MFRIGTKNDSKTRTNDSHSLIKNPSWYAYEIHVIITNKEALYVMVCSCHPTHKPHEPILVITKQKGKLQSLHKWYILRR
jgi:hypothetical protein